MVIFDSVVVFYGKRGCPRPEDRGQGSEPKGRGRSWRHRVPCPGAPARLLPSALALRRRVALFSSRSLALPFLPSPPSVVLCPGPTGQLRSGAAPPKSCVGAGVLAPGPASELGAGHRTWRHVRLHAVLRAASAPVFIGISGAFRTRRGNTHCFGSWSKTKRGNVPPRKTGCYSYKRLKNKGL